MRRFRHLLTVRLSSCDRQGPGNSINVAEAQPERIAHMSPSDRLASKEVTHLVQLPEMDSNEGDQLQTQSTK